MSGWGARKVFWQAVSVLPDGPGWAVALDGRRVQTPARVALVLPTRALADAVAAEWAAQRVQVDPHTMPATRMANAAIDKVAPQRAEVADLLAAYGGSDLVCYRAPGPQALRDRQAAAWDPLLGWAADTLGARLRVGTGVAPVPQDGDVLAALAAPLVASDPFCLAALHDLISLSGSLVLALAVARGRLTPAQGWAASRIDEDWQAELWGQDAEAQGFALAKQADFVRAARFFTLALCESPKGN